MEMQTRPSGYTGDKQTAKGKMTFLHSLLHTKSLLRDKLYGRKTRKKEKKMSSKQYLPV
jgi:hypothetical protein